MELLRKVSLTYLYALLFAKITEKFKTAFFNYANITESQRIPAVTK